MPYDSNLESSESEGNLKREFSPQTLKINLILALLLELEDLRLQRLTYLKAVGKLGMYNLDLDNRREYLENKIII